MPSRINCTAVIFSLALVAGVGCHKAVQPLPLTDIKKNYDRELPPGQFALRKIDPSQYPNFGDGWYRAKGVGLREAVQHSIAYLKTPSSKKYYPMGPITHDNALASLELFLQVLDSSSSPEALNTAIREKFDVYMSVGCDDEGTVLFTGYYSPIFDGSLTQTDQCRYPLYKLPADFKKTENGDPIGGPWHTRGEIEKSNMLAGHEIVWLPDRFEAYVISVQGSGFIRLPDGRLYEIGYAGHNGHEYTSIGKLMVADGKIERSQLSLDKMIHFFKENPQELDNYLPKNERYVFFQDSKGGPYGCLGQPVTPFHSIATDKDIFPRGCLAFIDSKIPDVPGQSMKKYRSFACDQDRGAAIRAPGRSDIYMGVGEAAGRMAGYTQNEGKLYYIFAKDGAAPTPSLAGATADEKAAQNNAQQQE